MNQPTDRLTDPEPLSVWAEQWDCDSDLGTG